MRPVRSLLIYVVVVFAGGALIAPWVYWLVQTVAPHSHLAENPFHRFVDRSLLGIALLGIWPLLRSLGAKSWRDVGLVKPVGQGKLLATGAMLGFGSLAAVAAVVLAIHGRQINPDLASDKIAQKLIGAVLTAIVVAVLEEILFRGAIFGAFRKIWKWPVALLISSMIYAIVHFLRKADLPGPVIWMSGFQLLPLMLSGFGELHVIVPGFFNLTLAGVLLGLAYQRTGNLYFSMGLHAGWIFWLKSYGMLTSPTTNTNTWLWGTEKLIDGWLAFAVLALTIPVLLRLLPDKARSVFP